MTKQTQAAPEEKPNAELLDRRFKLMDEFIENLKQQNINAGIEVLVQNLRSRDPRRQIDLARVMRDFVPWYEIRQRKIRYKGWLESVTHPTKPGKYNTIADLKKREKIPEDMISEHEGKTYPYRRLNSLYKIKKDGKLYLMRIESWYGLSSAGEEIMISVNDLDYWVKPKVTHEYIPRDPSNPNGPSIRLGSIVDNQGNDPLGDRIYLTPYSKEKVDEFLRYGSINPEDPKAGTIFVLQKEGQHGSSVTYQDFVSEEDFEETLKRVRKPAPTFENFMNDIKERVKQNKNDVNAYG
jgi:hypothetical protein